MIGDQSQNHQNDSPRSLTKIARAILSLALFLCIHHGDSAQTTYKTLRPTAPLLLHVYLLPLAIVFPLFLPINL
jgi:hypothetical protein